MYRRERERRLLHGEEKGGGEVKGRLGREREDEIWFLDGQEERRKCRKGRRGGRHTYHAPSKPLASLLFLLLPSRTPFLESILPFYFCCCSDYMIVYWASGNASKIDE